MYSMIGSMGLWMMGNSYGHRSGYYGKYPHLLKKRIESLFPDCNRILHLFSGKIQDNMTYDINPYLQPTICDDVRNIRNYTKLMRGIDLVIADPPYDKSDFQKYGQKPFFRLQVPATSVSITINQYLLSSKFR